MILLKIKRFSEKYNAYKEKTPFYFNPIQSQDDVFITIDNKKLLNFTTFSYLGLLNHPEIIKASIEGIQKYGVGLQGTRMLGGNLAIYEETEEALARILNRDAGILFQSGFIANLATIQSLTDRTSIIFCAKNNHASILDGCRISKAHTIFFDHKDLDYLNSLLERSDPNISKLIIVDSIFSMDGDLVDFPKLLAIRNKHSNTLLMVDESHSFGTIGVTGRGIEQYYNTPPEEGADLILASLSKAIPGNGGVVVGKKDIIRFLRYQARPLMFSSSLPATCVSVTKASVYLFEKNGEVLIEKLRNNVKFLRERLRSYGIPCEDHPSPITGIMIHSEELSFKISQACFDQGLYLLPVGFPAVARGKERLRITITVNHSEEQIAAGCDILANNYVIRP